MGRGSTSDRLALASVVAPVAASRPSEMMLWRERLTVVMRELEEATSLPCRIDGPDTDPHAAYRYALVMQTLAGIRLRTFETPEEALDYARAHSFTAASWPTELTDLGDPVPGAEQDPLDAGMSVRVVEPAGHRLLARSQRTVKAVRERVDALLRSTARSRKLKAELFDRRLTVSEVNGSARYLLVLREGREVRGWLHGAETDPESWNLPFGEFDALLGVHDLWAVEPGRVALDVELSYRHGRRRLSITRRFE